MMKNIYDVIIIGAGPGGIFTAYELSRLCKGLKIAVFETGNPLHKRHCPIDGVKIKSCIHCKSCDIMNGFGGAGAFSDGKYNITNQFGGTLHEYVGKSEALELMLKYMKDEYTYRIPAKDGVPETLFELKKRGFSLNVLTASPHDVLDPCLKRLGLYDVFDNVWSCNDFNTTKADPEIYRMAAEKIGSSVSSVTFLDDNLNADRTAKSAGMKVIGVYDESSRDYVEEMKAVCDGYIYNFKELMHP